MLYSQRLNDYRVDMGLTKDQLARVLDIAPSTASGYFNGRRTPPFESLISNAQTLCVSLDWLCGLAPGPRWGTEVMKLRRYLRKKAPEVQASDAQERVLAVMRLVEGFSPLFARDWFAAGVMGLPIADYLQFMAGTGDLAEQTPARVAEFTDLPDLWLLLGEAEYFDRSISPEWERVALAFEEVGLTPEEVAGQVPTVKKIVSQLKRTIAASQD
ncbi:MAG: Helix-turn-helix domain [Firmicutes bacterium]|nr:Helix-turn-helix domain [Bacillota bacterium]